MQPVWGTPGGGWSRRRRRRFTRTVVVSITIIVVIALVATSGGHKAKGTNAAGSRTANGSTATAGAATTATTNPRGSGAAVTLAFGGDVHFADDEATRLAADPSTALAPLNAMFAGSDISMVNVESAITTANTCPEPATKQFIFDAPPTAYTALKDAGITVVTQANDHGEDCGAGGLSETLAAAQAANYPVIGIGQNADDAFRPYRATIRGQRIAIIAATDVLDTDLATAWTATDNQAGVASAIDPARLVAAVEAARTDSDTVVVYLHWGTEAQTCPDTSQPPLAAMLIKAGADVVVGTNAHVQVGAGYEGSSFVDYGLGNLAFYDSTPPESYAGVLDVTVTGRHIDNYTWKPADISDGLPATLSGSAASEAITRWDGLRSCTNLSANPT